MAIIKIINSARKNYTIVDNSMLQDQNLSLAEKGLMAYLLQLPNDWDISQTQVERATNTGRRTIQKLFDGLINKGYMIKRETRDERGRFQVEYDVHEKPTQVDFEVIHNENHRSTFTAAVEPTAVNAPQLNTNTKLVKYKINNTNTAPVCVREEQTIKRSRVELFEAITKQRKDLLAYLFDPKQQEVANEVINTMVDIVYYAEHNGFYKANNKHYTKKQVFALMSNLEDDAISSVIGSVLFHPNPEQIKDRNRYILAALLKQAEASRKIVTSDPRLLELDNYVPNYLEARN